MLLVQGAKHMTTKGRIYVATDKQVWLMQPVPILEQVDQLVEEKEFDEATHLLEVSRADVAAALEGGQCVTVHCSAQSR